MHSKQPEIVVQISSIATLGQTDKWLGQTLFKTLGASMTISGTKPKFRIIFPSADEVRRSLNGYSSGSAIHTKIQTAAQRKQLDYLKPMLCYWAGDGAHHSSGRVLFLVQCRPRLFITDRIQLRRLQYLMLGGRELRLILKLISDSLTLMARQSIGCS